MKSLFFIIVAIVFFLANFWVLQRIYSLFTPSIPLKILFIFLGIILSLSYVVSNLFENQMSFQTTSFFARVGSAWIFIVIYLTIIFGLQELILLMGKLGIFPNGLIKIISKDNKWFTCLEIIIVALVLTYGYINYKNKKRTYISYQSQKTTENFQPLRIVLLSDMHIGYTIGEDELSKWVELVNTENPDIVLIAGDLFDSSIRAVDRPEIISQLKKINSKYGVYACLGNHEYLSSRGYLEKLLPFYDKVNIKLLRDQTIELDNGIYIIGRDDLINPTRKSLTELTKSLDPNKLWILLDHQPYHLELAEQAKIDLQFSGHTHQGQLWPISWITNAIFEKDYGWLEKGKSSFYISSGMGIWGGKFRVGTNSEYVIIDIEK